MNASPQPASSFSDDLTPNAEEQTVFVVEDDADTREAITALLEPTGCTVSSHGSAEDFLQIYRANGPACLLLDQQLPGMTGQELVRKLHADGVEIPTVVVTAFATTPMTVDVMRHGALTVLDKPCSKTTLQSAVEEALQKDRDRRERGQAVSKAKEQIASLNESEQSVLQMVLAGTPNKQIAKRMGVCVRTVEARRSKIYQTTGVTSVAELARLCVAAGFVDA